MGIDHLRGDLTEFMVPTATRSGEVRNMIWDEVDLESRLWVVPQERMKAGKERRVPLLQMVDVHLPTTDGHHLVLPHHTQPTPDQRPLLRQLDLRLAEQPTPRIAL